MADNKNKTGEPDRSLVNTSEAYEVTYWRNKFGCTEETLKMAVKNVGNKATSVEAEVARLKKLGSK